MSRITRLAILRFVERAGGVVTAQGCWDEFMRRPSGYEVEDVETSLTELVEDDDLIRDADLLRTREAAG